jgi:c-di-GMP-binding flagellar brake protein YcgR
MIIVVVIIGLITIIGELYRNKIKFFINGLDSKFTLSEILFLWKISGICNLEDPFSLYWSMSSLTNCILQIKSEAEKSGIENNQKTQKLLTKLYLYRTKIERDADKKKGLDSTRELDKGQKLRIIFSGRGVFSSIIVNNARELTISIPTQKNLVSVEGKNWIGKTINVYLWRKSDARYVFDTEILGEGLFLGNAVLYLRQTNKMLRTQKRQFVRTKCRIYANLFIIKTKIINYNFIDTKPGYRCLIEDISESGALVRIGGKGVPNVQIRLQFQLEGKLIIMFGVVRTVEYNKILNQSRLHFECIHIEPMMKNKILSYVYNILPEREKEIYDALLLTDKDENDINMEDIHNKIDNNEIRFPQNNSEKKDNNKEPVESSLEVAKSIDKMNNKNEKELNEFYDIKKRI